MKNILIVEDQPDVLKLLEMVLRTEDRKILPAENGEKGLRIAREIHPDVVLLDIMLPGKIDGYQVAREIKKDPVTAKSSIIVMTANVQEKDRRKAMEAGADDFIGKPYDLNDLKSKVARFLD